MLKKGKELIENRKQALIIADKEGWDVALGYVKDPIVKNAEHKKRLKKARKEAATTRANKEAGKKRAQSFTDGGKSKIRKGEVEDTREGNMYGRLGGGYNRTEQRSGGFQPRACWLCGSFAHLANNCTRNNTRNSTNSRY